MRNVLEALRQNSNTQHNCIRTSEKGYEKVIMSGNYQASTRSSVNEGFALSVELKFSFDNNKVYLVNVVTQNQSYRQKISKL